MKMEMEIPKIKRAPTGTLEYFKRKNIFDGSEQSLEISIFFPANIKGLGKQLIAVARMGRWPVILVPFIETKNGIEQMNADCNVVLETTQPRKTSRKLVSEVRKRNHQIFEDDKFSYIATGIYPVMVIRIMGESKIELK